MPEAHIDTSTRNAVAIIAAVACGVALYLLRGILTPLALALFLAVMVDGLARVLSEHPPHLPSRTALPVAVALSIILFGGSAWMIADNATTFGAQLVEYQPKLESLIARAAGWVGMDAPPTLEQLYRQASPGQFIATVAKRLQNFVADAAFVLIYLAFILASRRGFRRKVVAMFPSKGERDEAMQVFRQIRDGVERYLWVQTVTGLMIAGGSLAVMLFVGLDNALFWTFLIFLASYIPIIGGFIGIALPPIFALVQFDTWWQALVLLVALNLIQFVVGNLVQPRMQGHSLNIDPVVVLLSLALWGLLWGIPGMFLSTPLTVAAMVILAQFPATHRLAVLISADGSPQGVSGNPASARDSPKPKKVEEAHREGRAKNR